MEVNLMLVGIIVVFVGFFLIVIGSLTAGKGEVKWGVGGFIGPLPFGFANEKWMLYLVIGISALMFVIFFILSQKFA